MRNINYYAGIEYKIYKDTQYAIVNFDEETSDSDIVGAYVLGGLKCGNVYIYNKDREDLQSRYSSLYDSNLYTKIIIVCSKLNINVLED